MTEIKHKPRQKNDRHNSARALTRIRCVNVHFGHVLNSLVEVRVKIRSVSDEIRDDGGYRRKVLPLTT